MLETQEIAHKLQLCKTWIDPTDFQEFRSDLLAKTIVRSNLSSMGKLWIQMDWFYDFNKMHELKLLLQILPIDDLRL